MEQVDPIRARIDARIDDLDWGDSFAPLADALRAVLDILADPPVPSRMLIPVIREAIIDHLGVTHG